MNIYVASSWRNSHQQHVVQFLRSLNHNVYDFRNPAPGDDGFHWSEIDPNWQKWTSGEFRAALDHPIANHGFGLDMAALSRCDACVLVLPCGRSAHLELGWAIGAGKKTVIYMPDDDEPELMYKMCGSLVLNLPGVQYALFDGHSMGRHLPCGACGDLDGCHRWQEPNGNQFDARKYATA